LNPAKEGHRPHAGARFRTVSHRAVRKLRLTFLVYVLGNPHPCALRALHEVSCGGAGSGDR